MQEAQRFTIPAEEMEKLAQRMLKAPDVYAKSAVLDGVVDYSDRASFMWHMIAEGIYPAWEDPAIWSELAEHAAEASVAQIVEFLTKVRSFGAAPVEAAGDAEADAYDDGGYDYGGYDYGYEEDGGAAQAGYRAPMLLSYWPQHLDDLVFGAYATDSGAFQARMAEFSDDVKSGLRFVAFRTGHADAPPEGVLSELAAAQVGEGLLWPVKALAESGEVIELDLGEEATLRRFVEQFGSWDQWGRALLDAAMQQEFLPEFSRLHGVWTVASADELRRLLAEVSIYGDQAARVVERLLDRAESATDFAALARALATDGRARGAEIAATAALLRAGREGSEVPEGVEQFIEFAMFGTPAHRSRYEAVDLFTEALMAIPTSRLEARIRELFAGEYTKHMPFPALRVARLRGLEVLDAALAALRSIPEERQTLHGLRDYVVGLSWLPPSDLDRILAELDKPGTPAMKDAFHRAALGILADAETVATDYDALITYVDWRDPNLTAGDLTSYVFDDVHSLVAKLDAERAERVLRRDAERHGKWGRVFAGLARRPLEAAVEVALQRLADEGIDADERPFFEDLLRSHPEVVKPKLGAVLAAQPDPELHNSVKSCLGEQAYEEVLAAVGATRAADQGAADKLRRLCEAYFAAHPDAARSPVTIFRRSTEPPSDGAIGRIGGRPFGVTRETWPTKDGDEDLPMEHLVTIDVASAPSLQRLEGVRAVALFCHSPPHNEAYRPGNSWTEVMLLSDEDVARGPYEGPLPAGRDEAVAVIAEALEVPSDCFGAATGTDAELEAIKAALYQSSAWSGPSPLWLQEPEHFGDFLFQFDERFVHMNLGDSGVMYVFSDTAFWQCH